MNFFPSDRIKLRSSSQIIFRELFWNFNVQFLHLLTLKSALITKNMLYWFHLIAGHRDKTLRQGEVCGKCYQGNKHCTKNETFY